MKTCTQCGATKDAGEFNKRRGKCKTCQSAYRRAYGLDRRHELNAAAATYRAEHRDELAAKSRERNASMSPGRRREANRAYGLKALYGLTVEEYDAMLTAQGGGCALCGRKATSRALCVDHDHETGVVRGILCLRCNTALGTLGDNAEGLERALRYLRGAE